MKGEDGIWYKFAGFSRYCVIRHCWIEIVF